MKHRHILIPVLLVLITLQSCSGDQNNKGENSDTTAIVADTLNEEEKLIAELDQRIAADPNNANHYHTRSFTYFRMGNYAAALSDVNRSIKIDSTVASFHYTKGEIYFADLKIEEAIESYRAALRHKADYVDAQLRIARIYMYLKNWNEAMKQVNAGLRMDATVAEGYFMKGEIYEELKDTAKAASSFQTAVERDPEYYEAYIRLGLLYANAHSKLALDYYNSALSIRPNSIEAMYDKAKFMQDHGMINEALQVYDDIIALNANIEIPWYNKGYIHLVHTGNYNEAVLMFNRALEINARYIDAWYNRGLAYEALRDFKKARADYKKALEIDPTYDLAAEALDQLDRRKL
jgi:tetratricopeptide (TPR) repeat protein